MCEKDIKKGMKKSAKGNEFEKMQFVLCLPLFMFDLAVLSFTNKLEWVAFLNSHVFVELVWKRK